MTVEAELQVAAATAQLVCFQIGEPADDILFEQDYWLDLCLSPRPRNARACYQDRWASDHFERIGDLHWTDGRLKAGLDTDDANIRSLLLRLADEVRHPGFASSVLVELIAAQLAIEVARYCGEADKAPTVGALAPWRLRLIDERLTELQQSPTLCELAGLCKLSVRQLTRGFRKSRGCSIGEYVAQSRLKNAQRLLGTDQSVKTIAYSLGFASPSSFSYAFRRAMGQTPRQFRQRELQVG